MKKRSLTPTFLKRLQKTFVQQNNLHRSDYEVNTNKKVKKKNFLQIFRQGLGCDPIII